MKKLCTLLLTLCLIFCFSSCDLIETDPPEANTPSDGDNGSCNHSETKILEALEATCTSTGLTEGKKCLSCGEILEEQKEVEIKPHSYDNENDIICDFCGFINSESPLFIVSEVKTNVGSEKTAVTVALKNNPGIASIVLSLNYDNEALELVEIEYNTEIGGQMVHPQELISPVTLYWINGLANTSGDFVFATLYFDVSEDADGEYGIEISYEADNVYNIDEENLNIEVINGKICVE